MTQTPSTDELLDLTGLIYESALEPATLRPALAALSRTFRSAAAHIYTYHRSTGQVLQSHSTDERRNQQYLREWAAVAPAPRKFALLPSGSVVLCHELFDEAFVARNSFYQEYFIPAGFRWAMGASFHAEDGTGIVVANVRSADSPAFEKSDAALMVRLLPHFRRAALLRAQGLHRLGASAGIDELLGALPHPCLVLDAWGRVVARNDAACAAGPGLGALIVGGHLRFPAGRDQDLWDHMTRQVHQTGEAASFGNIHLVPWRNFASATDALEKGLILAIFDAGGGTVMAREPPLALHHRLTKAESEVLALMAKGLTAKDIAAQRNSSVHTIRSQIKAVLEKTGARSQRELLAKMNQALAR